MSDRDQEGTELLSVGRLTGKTTTHEVKALITNPQIQRNSYFLIFGDEDETGEKEYFVLNILEMWSDSKGLRVKLQVLGERPQRPFDVGAELFLANKHQISSVLGINNPPEESVALGKLLGYEFDVNLLVKNFGRIFITGKSGSGKSYTMGVLIEEFLKKNIPVVVIDRHGEYGSLKVESGQGEQEDDDESDVEHDSLELESSKQHDFCPWCGTQLKDNPQTCPDCGKSLELEMPVVPKMEAITEAEEEQVQENVVVETTGEETKEREVEIKESELAEQIFEYSDLDLNEGADIDIEYLFSLDPKDVVAPGICSIVNLRGMDLEVQEIIAGKIFKRLYQASVERNIPPFYLFLDEAHLFAGKKQTEVSEVVKLFAQEGRKFGANIVISTQRPQLLDVTIRAQAGTWIVHNLTDVRDINITISSAEDLSKNNTEDISGLDKGEAIVCGEAVAGIPLFIKVRKRETKHGGAGFNPMDFLSEQTVEELQARRDKLLGVKSKEELEAGKNAFKDILKPKSLDEYVEENRALKLKLARIVAENEKLKKGLSEVQPQEVKVVSNDEAVMQKMKQLQTDVNVWKEKYNYLKSKADSEKMVQEVSSSDPDLELEEQLAKVSGKVLALKNEVEDWKRKYQKAIKLAEKSITELKKNK